MQGLANVRDMIEVFNTYELIKLRVEARMQAKRHANGSEKDLYNTCYSDPRK